MVADLSNLLSSDFSFSLRTAYIYIFFTENLVSYYSNEVSYCYCYWYIFISLCGRMKQHNNIDPLLNIILRVLG